MKFYEINFTNNTVRRGYFNTEAEARKYAEGYLGQVETIRAFKNEKECYKAEAKEFATIEVDWEF